MLSPHLPLGAIVVDSENQRTVEWFFENLLPEGNLREFLARKIGARPENTWKLIQQYGKDVAGALSILPDSEMPDVEPSLTQISTEKLASMIREAQATGVPVMAQGATPHISLAGAQEKFALHRDASGAWWQPQGTSPSTWILKPENTSPRYPFCPANEWLCMNLAKAVWPGTPTAHLFDMEECRVYAVQRYDRVVQDGRIRRLHQIDLCQANNVPLSRKYDDGAGLSMDDLFATVGRCASPVAAKQFVVQWIILNYLVGNDDAHAKNLSFLVSGQSLRVAPVYDLLCVDAYHQNFRLSMPIEEQTQAGWVEGKHWDAFALRYGVKPIRVRKMLQDTASRIEAQLPGLLTHGNLKPDEIGFLQERVVPVIRQRMGFVADALKTKVLERKKGTEFSF